MFFRSTSRLSRPIGFLVGLSFLCAQSAFALTPNDPDFDKQWYLNQIAAPAAWDAARGSDDVIVAVLDTGVDLNHPDLVDHLWQNPGEIRGDRIDNDGNGFIDDIRGWNFVENDNNPEPYVALNYDAAAASHGTIIAGIIGAMTDNAAGVAGINWHVKIMPVKILDSLGSGNSDAARRAVDYAVANHADIINLSFTGFENDPQFFDAIVRAYEAGVTVVAAVGNDDKNNGLNLDQEAIYPACYRTSTGADPVIGVAATDREDRKATFSNYGSDCTDLSAPGVDVFGTLFQDSGLEDFQDYYAGYWSGTSVAAPMVTGAAAILKAAYSTLTPDEIRETLQLSVDPVRPDGAVSDGQMGAGRINIAQALTVGASFAHTPAITPAPAGIRPLLVAQASAADPVVREFDPSGALQGSFEAYAPTFQGGVRLAMGDVDGDGADEIVTVPGPGGGPQVRVFETDGTVRSQFFAFPSDTRTGLFVTTGDLNGDGKDEIITAEDAGGNGEVRVFTMGGEQESFLLPFDRTTQGVRVATGDLDGDGRAEIIAGLGPGGSPRVRVFKADGTFVDEFDAYAPTYDRGIFVAAGDVNGDGKDEIVTGTDTGGGPHVRVFTEAGVVLGSFFAYDSLFRGGVRVAVADLDRDGTAEIYTAAGPGGGPHVRVFNASGTTLLPGFFAFDESIHTGINVAAR